MAHPEPPTHSKRVGCPVGSPKQKMRMPDVARQVMPQQLTPSQTSSSIQHNNCTPSGRTTSNNNPPTSKPSHVERRRVDAARKSR